MPAQGHGRNDLQWHGTQLATPAYTNTLSPKQIWYLRITTPPTPQRHAGSSVLLVLRLGRLLVRIARIPTLRRVSSSLVLQGYLLSGTTSTSSSSSSSSVHLVLHVRSVLDVLMEVADVAADIVVWLEGEGNDGDEAEGEPLPAEMRG